MEAIMKPRNQRTERPRVRVWRAGLVGLGLALLLPAALEAQNGNQSDVSGPIITGSTTGGAPPGSGAPPSASTPEGQAALASTVANFEAEAFQVEGTALPAEVQQALAELFSQGRAAPSAPALAGSLAQGCGQEERCLRAVEGLLDTMDILVRVPSRRAVSLAIEAFNALVAAAPESFLRSPPAEFEGIRLGILYFRAEVLAAR
jgi:hypothetical protein